MTFQNFVLNGLSIKELRYLKFRAMDYTETCIIVYVQGSSHEALLSLQKAVS